MDQMGVMSFKDLAEEMAKKRIEVLITSCRGMYFLLISVFYSFTFIVSLADVIEY